MMASHPTVRTDREFEQCRNHELELSLQERTAHMTNRSIWTRWEVKLQEEWMLCNSEVWSRRLWGNRHKLKQILISKIARHGHATEKHNPSNTQPARSQKLVLNSFSNSCNIGGGKKRACHDFHEPALIILQP